MKQQLLFILIVAMIILNRHHRTEPQPYILASTALFDHDVSNRHIAPEYTVYHTKYLFVITTDGLRWQELFRGADSTLLFNTAYVKDTSAYRTKYWDKSEDKRRETLFPFLWSTFVKNGQIYGNRNLGCEVNTANKMWFSYPGYNEMFTGRPDDLHIFSNAKWTNPNETVFEQLHRLPRLNGKIAAFATWDAFSAIFRRKKAGFSVKCGKECCSADPKKKATSFGASQIPPDYHTWTTAMDSIKAKHPHLAFIGLDDTDSRAHEGHYDLYLDAAHRFDFWLSELWDYIQQDTMYCNKTTILLTTDHGRGTGKYWKDHSMMVKGSDAIWMAAIGPDTPAEGEMRQMPRLYQKQIAQTIANFMGYHFTADTEVAQAVGPMFMTKERIHNMIAKQEADKTTPQANSQNSLKK